MAYKIEDGIPIEAANRDGACAAMRELKIGQSVLFQKQGVAGLISHVKRQTGFGFSRRKVADGIRVWRTA